jgi:hypothetical protein
MKELYGKNVLGTRLQKRCRHIELYMPFIDSFDRMKIDFPLVAMEISFFEKGLKFYSDKIGHFILFFDDVASVQFLSTRSEPWAIFNLKENNLFFSRLIQPTLCIRFTGEAQQKIFIPFREKLPEFGVPISDITDIPTYLQGSLSLKTTGYVVPVVRERDMQPADFTNHEIQEDHDYIKFGASIQKLKILSQNIKTEIEEEDATSMVNPKRPEAEAAPGVNIMFIVGPPFSGKRAFGQAVYSLREKFPAEGSPSYLFISYEDQELPTLKLEDFVQTINKQIQGESDGDKLNPGDWVVIVVPHVISHLQLIETLRQTPGLSVQVVICKINANDFYNKNLNPVTHLRRYLEEGWTTCCFLDYEGMSSDVYADRADLIRAAYRHVTILDVHQNKVLWMRLQQAFSIPWHARVKQAICRKYSTAEYVFGEEVIRLDYRIPILEDQLQRFKEVVIDLEGALMNPENEPEPEDEEAVRARRRNMWLRAQDELKENIKKLMSVMRGLIAKRDQKTVIPFITRMKGVFRFEGKLDKGPYSLYLSPYGFYFENLGLETPIEQIEKNGVQLIKATYEDFDFQDFGFYIYGKNLDPKAITLWFNKNLLPVICSLQ